MDRHTIEQREPPSASPTAGYVLVVDDEELVRTFLMRCLERGGYAVKDAGTAAMALEVMGQEPASVVLCDVRMPEQDGLWLADRLRENWPDTRVVMATAVDDLETIRQCRDLGAVDYVIKPIMPEQLLKVVHRAATAPNDDVVLKSAIHEEVAAPGDTINTADESRPEAEYELESPVRCPSCAEMLTSVRAIRMIRAHVNFTSTLPRRGHVIACPYCLAVIPAELTNF